MALILKAVAAHGLVGNAPYIISVAATAAPAAVRTFTGAGAPGSATLNPGNGLYNGLGNGCVINASLTAPGAGYTVADVLTLAGGTLASGGFAAQVTVDMVNAAGAIQDFHVSRAGNYAAYPGASVAVTGGGGVGAQFLVNPPAPDYYLDLTTPAAPVLYVCQTGGTNSASVWAKVGGGAGGSVQQFKIVSDAGDCWVCNPFDGTTTGTLNVNVIKPHKLRAGLNQIGSETIRGVVYTYTYAGVYISGGSGPYAYYTRAVSGNDGSGETDYLTPDPIANDIIYAMPCATTILAANLPVTIASASPASAGMGYAVNQILTVSGGTVVTGYAAAQIKVTAVNGSGGITGCSMYASGNYLTPPSLTAAAVTSGSATLALTLAPQLLDINADARAWAK